MTRACELGDPLACAALARRLSASCVEEPDELPCLALDDAGAQAARTLACEAGWGDAEACGAPGR